MKIIANENRTYNVVADDGTVLAVVQTHSEAWRFIDRFEGEPISRAEKTSQFLYDNQGPK